MAANRGGRGWQEPTVTVNFDLISRLQADEFQRLREWKSARAQLGIIDLINVGGVWMSLEDARNERQPHR